MLSHGGDLDAVQAHRPFRRRGLLRRTVVFPVAILIALALFPGRDAVSGNPRFLAALALALLFLPLVVLTPWDRLPDWAQLVAPLAYLAVIALLRDAYGGAGAGFAPFLFLPLLWLAVYGTRRQFAAGLLAVWLALTLPILVVGGDAYPSGEWRRAFAFVFVGALIGYSVQVLVNRLFAEMDAREAAERLLRERGAFDLHDDVVQDLARARLALALEDRATAEASIGQALARTQQIVAQLLAPSGGRARIEPGSLRRSDDERLQADVPPA